MDLHEFKASLVYKVSSRTAKVVTEKPCLKNIQREREERVDICRKLKNMMNFKGKEEDQ